jgi:telomere length regulation protein
MTEQITVMEAIFRDTEKKYLSAEILVEEDPTSNQTVGGIAALCSIILTNRPHLEAQVIDWLSKGQGGSIHTVGLRRALVVNFADKPGEQEDSCLYIHS